MNIETNGLSRRTFIRTGAMALASLPLLASRAFIKVYHIPLHDAPIREQLTGSPAATLTALADTGFKELYFSGDSNHTYYGMKPAAFRQMLDDTPISVPIGQARFQKHHWLSGTNALADEWKIIMDNALEVGQEYLVSPGLDWDLTKPDQIQRGIEAYNRAGELMEEAGLRLLFAPTAREFTTKRQGQPVYDFLMQNMDSLYVGQQLDLALLAQLGQDTVVWMRKNPHPIESLQVQDFAGATRKTAALGKGSLPLDDILAFARKNTPVKYWIIRVDAPAEEALWKAVGNELQRFRQYGFI
jgi:sugar phosphate isomerase/epimerase